MHTLLRPLLLIVGAIASVAAPEPPRCTIEGRVVDARRIPLPGVEIMLSSVGEPWRTDLSEADKAGGVGGGHVFGRTGTDGRFIIRNSWGTGWGDKGFAYATPSYVSAAFFPESYGMTL